MCSGGSFHSLIRSRRVTTGFLHLACRGLIVSLVVMTQWSVGRELAAESTSSDSHALSRVFAEQHVADTAFAVHQRAMQMPAQERYRFLTEWVLPNELHDTLRLQYAFAPTNPAPVTRVTPDQTDVAESPERPGRRQCGGRIVSPVYDLLDVADELNRLDEVHERVVNWGDQDQTQSSQHRAAMLALIELRRQRDAVAAVRLDEFLRLLSGRAPSASEPSPAELLVFDCFLNQPAMREAVADALNRYLQWTRSEWHRTPVKRHVSAMFGRLRAGERLSVEGPATEIAEIPLKQWTNVSRATAATRGTGCPLPRWDFRPGQIENVTSHDDDFLYFGIPLRGHFEVECDVSGFGWRDSHLMIGGTWVAPVYTHAAYDLGIFRQELKRFEFTPPLTKTKEWIHYRTVVRDQEISTYFNGRLVRRSSVSVDHDPWIAVRSSPRHDGAVRNLRISGRPVIPSELKLSEDNQLSGWLSYFDRRTGTPNGVWYHTGNVNGGGEIVGNRIPQPGSFVASLLHAFSRPASERSGEVRLPAHQERLLRYHRPMLEDGTIEYEFFYSPGDILTHPAIDRAAFLLKPDGVMLHWVTDGEYERTGLSPANEFHDPGNRRGPEQLPLKAGTWNRMQVQLRGDTVSLTLNGERIYERPVESCSQRTFGLFYFADETQARVRNIVWKGNWPRELPPLVQQELAVGDSDFPDSDAERLAAVFDHSFVEKGLPLEQFVVVRGDPKAHLKRVDEGLLATRPGTGGYRNVTIAPALRIRGDFDVIASYRDFEATAVEGGNATATLMAILSNATSDESAVSRKYVHRANDVHENIGQCLQVFRPVEGERRDYFGTVPMEESSGRLRLARRGNQMYFLTAEGDSPHFQLRGQRETAIDDVQLNGLRLLTQIFQQGGHISIVWTHLIVRAEGLSGRAVEDFDSQLVRLNEEREQLKERFSWDFSRDAPDESLFRRWNESNLWRDEDGGLLIVAPGTDDWTSAGVSVGKSITGNFDISVSFDVLKFDMPKPGGRCAAYLQIEMPDQDRTQVSLIFTNTDTGRTEVIAQVREPRGKGKYNYRAIGTIDLEDAVALRIARRNDRLTFLVGSKDAANERIVGFLQRPPTPVPESNVRFFVHTGGANRESRVLLKAIDMRGDSIGKFRIGIAPEDERSLLDKAFDLFRAAPTTDSETLPKIPEPKGATTSD